jgi:Transposase DDE domain group 1
MKVTHAGRQTTVNVRADGDGLVSHAGSALLAQVADKTGLTRALNVMVGEPELRAGSHDRGRVIRDLAVMLADGGDCLADLRAVSDQAVLFGSTASPSTAFRVVDRIVHTGPARCFACCARSRACAGVGACRRAGAVDD